MRGLKLVSLALLELVDAVASFTDAWIETFNPEFDHIGYQVASFTDAWIETLINKIIHAGTTSHLLQMRGLKLS